MKVQPRRIVMGFLAVFVLIATLVGGAAVVSGRNNAEPIARVAAIHAPVQRTDNTASRGYERKPCPQSECPRVLPTVEPTVAPVVVAEAPKPKPTATQPKAKPAPPVKAGGGCAPGVSLPGNVVDIVHKYLSGCEADSLLWIISHESGGDVHATNPSSGAYGIPQAWPGSKMATAGADWRDSADTQIRWMIDYTHARYGGPIQAYQHWLVNHSY